MAEPQQPTPSAMKQNQMFIAGRIDHVTKFNDNFDHIVITPAADAYSKPSLIRVSASKKLGQAGDDIRTLAAFYGWSNNYKNKHGEDVRDVRGFFQAVE